MIHTTGWVEVNVFGTDPMVDESAKCDLNHPGLYEDFFGDAGKDNEECCDAEENGPCDVDEGDCDSNDECKEGLFCVGNSCIWGDYDDCCQAELPVCSADNPYGILAGNSECCSDRFDAIQEGHDVELCGEGEGDCDSDDGLDDRWRL